MIVFGVRLIEIRSIQLLLFAVIVEVNAGKSARQIHFYYICSGYDRISRPNSQKKFNDTWHRTCERKEYKNIKDNKNTVKKFCANYRLDQTAEFCRV